MLIKLIKYDLKWMFKILPVFYVLAFFFSIVSFFLSKIEDSALFSFINGFSNGFTVAMVVNALINSVIRAWVRFRQNVYKDEAYLTHTLPVPREKIFLSKTLAGIISVFTSVAVSVVCLVICFYNMADMINNLLKAVTDMLSVSSAGAVAIVFCELFFQLIFVLLLGYCSIILGHKSNKNKLAKSFIIGFAMYLVSNFVSVAAMGIAGFMNKDMMNFIKTSEPVTPSSVRVLLVLTIVLYFVYGIICYAIGRKALKKGVDID
ncbi:MAG: hypothetical protein K2I73_01255 [Eubacterium sp.]|nr:hypothetical protein [Eubacterium sp.]